MTVRHDRQADFTVLNGRRLYSLRFEPVGDAAPKRWAVLFAPFAEEMNRCRRMMTLQAEALAQAGIGAVVFDYSGTGDSAGAFEMARWADWIEDGAAIVDQLANAGAEAVCPIGLRLGAAIALEVAKRRSPRIDRVVLWQPVASGKTFVTQFLRLRVAAALSGAQTGETTASLRDRIAAGETVEVAGYLLTDELISAMEAVDLAALAPDAAVAWFEVSSRDPASLSPAGRKIVDRWSGDGVAVTPSVVAGDPFWSIQETTTAPALLRATTDLLAKDP